MIFAYANPYHGTQFFEFFGVLFSRLVDFCRGTPLSLAADELQLLVVLLIGLSCSIVGVFLVLRKMTMLANALSHTILTGVVLATLAYGVFTKESFTFTTLLPSESFLFLAALFMAFLTTFLSTFLVQTLRLKEDASCGIVFTFLFAVGVILVTLLSRNAHIGAELLMGNVDALHRDDLWFQVKVTLLNVALVAIFFRAYFVTTFDPVFGSLLGLSSFFFAHLLMAQTAVVTIAAFRAVGVLLVLAFFVGPPLVARVVTGRLMTLVALAVGVSVVIGVVGVALSRHILTVYDTPVSTAGLLVVLIALSYLCVLVGKKIKTIVGIRKIGHNTGLT